MSDLAQIGTALWGPEWKTEMVLQTGVNLRSVRRMNDGARPIPPSLKAELAVLLRAEARRLDLMAAALEADQCAS